MSEKSRGHRDDEESLAPRETALIGELVADPAAVPDLAVYEGRIGRSSLPDHVRLYLTDELDHYLELPRAHVKAAQAVPGSSTTKVWVERGKRIQVVSLRTTGADYLKGPICDAVPPRCDPPARPVSVPTYVPKGGAIGGFEVTRCRNCPSG